MKKLLSSFVLILSVLTLISCSSKDEIEGYRTYKNSDVGFTIQYPETWIEKEGFAKNADFESGSIVVFQNPSQGKKDLFRENVHIFTEAVPDSVKNVDDYYKYSITNLPNQLREMEILEDGKQMIDDKPVRWIIFNYVMSLQRVTSIGFMFYKDNKGFVITATARPEDFMSFRRTFENIATSIKFE